MSFKSLYNFRKLFSISYILKVLNFDLTGGEPTVRQRYRAAYARDWLTENGNIRPLSPRKRTTATPYYKQPV